MAAFRADELLGDGDVPLKRPRDYAMQELE
jgi:hypothetical protein